MPIDATAFGAFDLLKDNKWHSLDELRDRCGRGGERRARALREPLYGELTVETRLGSQIPVADRVNVVGPFNCAQSYWRLPAWEREAKYFAYCQLSDRDIVGKLTEALPRRTIADYSYSNLDKLITIRLTERQIVALLAKLDGLPQMRISAVDNRWGPEADRAACTLRATLPELVKDNMMDLLDRYATDEALEAVLGDA